MLVKSETFKIATSKEGLMDNDTFNLMEQLEVENKSLLRIRNSYKNSADSVSRQLWSFMEKDKEKVVRLLTEKIQERL